MSKMLHENNNLTTKEMIERTHDKHTTTKYISKFIELVYFSRFAGAKQLTTYVYSMAFLF